MDAQAVIVGGNFRFGFRQAGNIVTLRDLGQQLHFLVRSVEPVSFRQHSVSSSLIRRQIEDGDVALAARMLGRPYALSGEVVRGHGIGSKQTVPTLNLATDAQVLPEHGVYITRTTDLADGRVWDSITNVGVRPTFSGEGELTIETFLLSKLEGETPSQIQVELLRHVREERKFASPDELKAQIFRDVARANTFHRRAQKWISSLATQPRQ